MSSTKRNRSKALAASASCFIPRRSTHELTTKQHLFNPLALSFQPTPGRNVLATPFVPRNCSAQTAESSQKSADCIHTNDSLPAVQPQPSYPVCEFEMRQHLEAIPGVLSETFYDLPVSIIQIRAERGQLKRRPRPLSFLPLPSSFSLPNGHLPTSVPAGDITYNGSVENQRQIFQVQQKADREILYNWKGYPLSVTGEEMARDEENWSDEIVEAELRARPSPIHHINWIGKPVHFRSETPPAVSLVVIMSLLKPRGLSHGKFPKNLRQAVLFNNALDTIDPVCYLGDDVDVLFEQKGAALQNVVTGEVIKFYSEHGFWHQTYSENDWLNDDWPAMDNLDEVNYNPGHLILNGWYENHGLPVSRGFVQLDVSANTKNKLHRCLNVVKRLPFVSVKSKLNLITHRQDIPEYDIIKPVMLLSSPFEIPSQEFIVRDYSSTALYEHSSKSQLDGSFDTSEEICDRSVASIDSEHYDTETLQQSILVTATETTDTVCDGSETSFQKGLYTASTDITTEVYDDVSGVGDDENDGRIRGATDNVDDDLVPLGTHHSAERAPSRVEQWSHFADMSTLVDSFQPDSGSSLNSIGTYHRSASDPVFVSGGVGSDEATISSRKDSLADLVAGYAGTFTCVSDESEYSHDFNSLPAGSLTQHSGSESPEGNSRKVIFDCDMNQPRRSPVLRNLHQHSDQVPPKDDGLLTPSRSSSETSPKRTLAQDDRCLDPESATPTAGANGTRKSTFSLRARIFRDLNHSASRKVTDFSSKHVNAKFGSACKGAVQKVKNALRFLNQEMNVLN